MWAPAINAYWIALWLQAVPFEIGWMRVTSAIVGLGCALMLYLALREAQLPKITALAAMVFLAIAPAHFMHSRIVLEHIYALFFQLAWSYFLLKYERTKNLADLLLAGLMLGVGFHSYHATKILMPLAWLFTLLVLWKDWWTKRHWQVAVVASLGFWIPLVPLLTWLPRYPDTFVDQVRYNNLYNASDGIAAGLASMLTWESVYNRTSVYLSYFNPSFIWTRSDISLVHSTREAGALLLPTILLLPFGLRYAWRERHVLLVKIVWFCIFSAPIPTAIANQGERVSRVLPMVVGLVVMVAWGWQELWKMRTRNKYIYASMVVVFTIVFYMGFLIDYFGDYKIRSANWFNGNMEGIVAQVANFAPNTGDVVVYVDDGVRFAKQYFDFYKDKYKLEKVSVRTIPEKPVELSRYNAGEILVLQPSAYAQLRVSREVEAHEVWGLGREVEYYVLAVR
jgi:4-amino-4-deoxy-L-arabinose transferase-like glycosyltransferase